MTNFNRLVDNFYHQFNYRRLDNGSIHHFLEPDAPQWMLDAIREAHDGELRNNWRYKTAISILESLVEYQTIEDATDNISAIADNLANQSLPYLARWLAEAVNRQNYVNAAMDIYGCTGKDIDDLIRNGQYMAIEQMARVLINAVEEQVTNAG